MFGNFRNLHRVVISGFGCVSPIGVGKQAFWQGLKDGKSGVSHISSFDVSNSTVQIAAEIRDFDAEAEISIKDRRHVPRTVPLALASARQALLDSQIKTEDLSLEERRNFGVVLGTGGGGLSFTEKQYEAWYVNSGRKASVYTIPSSTHGSLSSELSMAFGLHGMSHIISTGCTSSTDAISYAAQNIALGKVDTILAGGVDARLKVRRMSLGRRGQTPT